MSDADLQSKITRLQNKVTRLEDRIKKLERFIFMDQDQFEDEEVLLQHGLRAYIVDVTVGDVYCSALATLELKRRW